MMSNLNLKKEVCECCSKTINIGQAIVECNKCSKIIHTKCYKLSNFSSLNCLYYCDSCCSLITKQYNPFKSQHSHNTASDNDNFYDNDLTDTLHTISKGSNILDNCKAYNLNELDDIISNNNNINFTTCTS